MKKLITTLLLSFILVNGFGQKGTTYTLVGYEDLIDSAYEKVIGKEWIDWKDGTEAGMYYIVEYDYGEPPPDYMELTKSYLTHGFPDTIRGWVVKDTLQLSMGGDYAYLVVDLIQTCTNKVNSKLPMYVERMTISIGDEFNIRIWATEEEMKRRSDIIDAELQTFIKTLK